MTDELIIDDSNFNEYFFDIRKHKPKKGQIMACYSAMAEFVRGNEKQQIIDLLQNTDKVDATVQVMRKLLHAAEPDCYTVLLEISNDILSGMTVDEVLDKAYRYKVELYYYVEKQYVPENDPHWSTISLLNLEN